MISYDKLLLTKADDRELESLVALSTIWAEEKTMPSYHPNVAEDFLNRELYVARSGDDIIAYALGDIVESTEKTSYHSIGEKTFKLNELYVVSAYRNHGVGRELYRFLEEDLKAEVQVLSVVAATHNYQDLLRFYIEELGMTFNHALLVKRLDT